MVWGVDIRRHMEQLCMVCEGVSPLAERVIVGGLLMVR